MVKRALEVSHHGNGHANKWAKYAEHAHGVGKELWKNRTHIKHAWNQGKEMFRHKTKGLPPKEMKGMKAMKKGTAKDDGIHSGATTLNIRIKPSLKHKKHLGKFTITESFTNGVFNALEGRQAVNHICKVADASNFMCTTAALANANATTTGANLLNLNVNSRNTGSATYALGQNYAENELHLVHAEVNLIVRSFTNIVQYVDIYCVEAKANIQKTSVAQDSFSDRTAAAIWISGLLNQDYGLAPQTSAGTFGNMTSDQPDARPQQAKAFNDLFKIKSVHHITLAAAAEETINYHCPLNMLIKGEKLVQENNYLGSGGDSVGNLVSTSQVRIGSLAHGLEFFCVFRGGVARNTTGGAVSFAPCEIGVVVERKLTLAANASLAKQVKTAVGFNNLEQVLGPNMLNVNILDNAAASVVNV